MISFAQEVLLIFTQSPNIIISSSPFISKYPSVELKLYVTLAVDDQTKICLGGCFSKALPSVGCQSTLPDPAFVPSSVTELVVFLHTRMALGTYLYSRFLPRSIGPPPRGPHYFLGVSMHKS